jgi:4-oxalomesaconate tautomerase
MGSGHPHQVDGIGGGHPLTSKVAIVSRASRADADVDYLFKQVGVTERVISDRQNCGNLLAGVAPFAIERGLVGGYPVRIHMVNSGEIATATEPDVLEFPAAADLFPTGRVRDFVDGMSVTCVDAGMPVVVIAASELGRTGYESVAELEADAGLGRTVRSLRLAAGRLMGLGDVSETTVPKVSLVARARAGGLICTRTFIPVRVHESIGVLGAVSVARAVLTEGSAGHELAAIPAGDRYRYGIEHPSGTLEVVLKPGGQAGVVRTARKLFDGVVFARED